MTAFKDYEHYDALGLGELVKQGKTTPAELLEAAIERVESRNGAVNAVTMAGSSQSVAVRCGVAIRRDIGLRE